MVKAPSPLLGFNNNVRHKGRVFHIQTEDSGVRHPHVITHLFADGGRILKTTKTSYAEHVGNDRLAETVRAMMQEQHKAMFIALRDGQFDYLFDENAAPPSEVAAKPRPKSSADQPAVAPPEPPKPAPAPEPIADRPAPAQVVAPPAADRVATTGGAPVPPGFATSPTRPALASPPAPDRTGRLTGPRPPTAPPPARVASSPLPPAPPPPPPQAEAAAAATSKRVSARPRLDVDPAAIHGAAAAEREASIDLDLDALERAAAEAQTPFYQQIQDLPPPPAAVLGNKRTSTGGYSVRAGPPDVAGPASPGRYGSGHTPPRRAPTPPTPPVPLSAHGGRYAPSRPASIFATTRPQEGSLFGENLISEKSLDEVILSYLADDLDGAPDKK